MTTSAPRVSSQDAVLLLLQSESGREAVLRRNRPVGFADLQQIAESTGSLEAGLALQWIEDLPATVLSKAENTAVLVVERELWLPRIDRLPEFDHPLPDDLVAAAVVDVPEADSCLVVPTGGRQPGDTVMLYAVEQSGDVEVLVPVALSRGATELVRVPQPCQLSPAVDCVSDGCTGLCIPRKNRHRGELVIVGCICT